MRGVFFRLITLPLYILFGFNARAVKAEPNLLLIDYRPNQPTRQDPTILELVARQTGFIAWILGKLGLLTRYSLKITASDVAITIGSMKGSQTFIAPLARINAIGLRLRKPIGAAIFGAVCLGLALSLLLFSLTTAPNAGRNNNSVGSSSSGSLDLSTAVPLALDMVMGAGNPVAIIAFIIVGGIALAYYALNKRFSLGVTTSDLEDHIALKFHISIIAGKNIDFDTLHEAVDTVSTFLLHARKS